MIDLAEQLDVDAAVINPAECFAAPIEVLNDSRLTPDEKRRILESWALDERLISQAEAENMKGTDRLRLQEVRLALLELHMP
jgi:hypothetical protein